MPAHLERALLLLNQGRPELAEPELRRALAEDPENAAAHAFLGLCLVRGGRHDEALAEVREAIGKAPGLPIGHYVMALVYEDQDRYDEADAALAEAIRLDPEDPDFFALRAQIRFGQRRFADALAAADQGLALDAQHPACTNLRGVALVQLGRNREARATIEGALSRNPDSAMAHANQGWALLHQNDPKRALDHFREALRLDPEMTWAKQGIVAALKARNPIYRVMLAYFLWMSRLSRQAQIGVILVVLFGQKALGSIRENYPALKPYTTPILILLLAFVYLTWVADPLFNLMLRINKYGRHALSAEQRRASNVVGLLLLGAVLSGLGALALWAAVGPGLASLALMPVVYFLILIVPASAIFTCPRGWPRLAMTAYTLGLAAVGAAAFAVLFGVPLGASFEGLVGTFFFGAMLSTWLAVILSQARS